MTAVNSEQISLPVLDFYRELQPLFSEVAIDAHMQALSLLIETYDADKTVLSVGNGGSATTAAHLICDLAKTARPEGRRALRGVALTEAAMMTAYANDIDYDDAFSAQLTAIGRPGDCLVAISVSGRSPNIVNALSAARESGIRSIAVLGDGDNPARSMADVAVVVPHKDPGIVETVHIAIMHSLTVGIRDHLVADAVDSV